MRLAFCGTLPKGGRVVCGNFSCAFTEGIHTSPSSRLRGVKTYNPQVCRYSEEGEVPSQLCRLGYLASIDRWAYAFYKYSDECYAPSVVASGSFLAMPEQALTAQRACTFMDEACGNADMV